MRKRASISFLLGLSLFVLAVPGSAQAEPLTPKTARAALVENLKDKYGPGFTGASTVWVKCPEEGILDFDGVKAYCMAEFEKGRTRTYEFASVDEEFKVKTLTFGRWHRSFRRCAPRYLREARVVEGVLATNDRRCSTAALMASDIDYRVRSGKLKRKSVTGWHGTNTAGYGAIATYVCHSKRRGNYFHVRCSNSLKDTFRLKVPTREARNCRTAAQNITDLKGVSCARARKIANKARRAGNIIPECKGEPSIRWRGWKFKAIGNRGIFTAVTKGNKRFVLSGGGAC